MVRVIILLIISVTVNAQSNSYEQSALDYFVQSIFKEKYSEVRTIEFACKTEKSYTSPHQIRFCFDDKELLEKFISVSPASDEVQRDLNVSIDNVKIVKLKSNSRMIKLYVDKSIKIDNRFYVTIGVYKRDHFANHYLFEVDENLKVLRWCNVDEII